MSFVKKLEKKPNFKNSSPSNDSEIWSAMDIDDYEKVMKEASTPEYHLKEKDSELSPEKRKLLREVRDNYRPNSPTKNRRDKPFSVPDKDFAYIDADQTDQLARKNFETVENGAANKFKCGNEETFPVEHDQHDGFGPRSQRNGVEKLNEIQKNIFCNEEEQLKFSSTSQLLNHSVRITSESSGGEFTTFKTTPIGSELVPKLTICEEAKEQLCPGESDRHMVYSMAFQSFMKILSTRIAKEVLSLAATPVCAYVGLCCCLCIVAAVIVLPAVVVGRLINFDHCRKWRPVLSSPLTVIT
ncbi:unnamed protein product [Caenorhabditis auriculariae]|uniref:Uncharacterized protein n=1 Tax=Caenorhabditis auriculariae TaxID=2777116 RepID=A0A8S1GYL2_9PELO|nr:unnamed protein product [Caenorhabditis auriculariae]